MSIAYHAAGAMGIGSTPIGTAVNPRMGLPKGICETAANMSFDENPDSPDKLVNPKKRTTTVNFALAAGVAGFLAMGTLAVWWFARHYAG
jgi:hypothetical protein